jgi:hypothetical protein
MKNWKTTLLGLSAAGLNLLANGMKWQQVLVSVALAALGLVAKDYNVSGVPGQENVNAKM